MNKSIEYIKNRIINQPDTVNNMPIDGWDNVVLINPLEMYKYFIPELKIIDNEFTFILNGKLENNKIVETTISIKYNPNIDYDYFTMEISTHDGTLLFTQQCMNKLLNKLLNLGTYAKHKVTQNILDNLNDYKLQYIIGDILIRRDFGIKNINGDMRAGQTDLIVLPIKMDINETSILLRNNSQKRRH